MNQIYYNAYYSVHDGFLKCYLLKSSQTTKLSQNTDTCIRIIYFLYNFLYKIISSNLWKLDMIKIYQIY